MQAAVDVGGTRQARALLRAVAESDGPGKDAARKALDRKR